MLGISAAMPFCSVILRIQKITGVGLGKEEAPGKEGDK